MQPDGLALIPHNCPPFRARRGCSRLRRVGRIVAGLLGIILAAALLSGCGNNPYPPGDTAKPILYLSLRDDPGTLDPSTSYTPQIIDNLFLSYLQVHYLKRNPNKMILALGAEMPKRAPIACTVTENGRTFCRQGERWTFRIKRGLHFQDDPCFPGGKGREIVAADFLYTFRRMADPAVGCPWLTFFDDKILGFHAYVTHNRERAQHGLKADYAAPVEGLQLDPKDPYVFRILVNQRFPQLRYMMGMRLTAPQAHEAMERYGKQLARHPVGCGPFLVAEYRPKQRLVLKVNPNRLREFYPGDGALGDRAAGLLDEAGQQLPRTEEIVYTVIREGVTAWNRFEQGYEDLWYVTQTNYQEVMSRQGQLSPEMVKRGIQLYRAANANITSFFFNMRDPVFGGYTLPKRRLRQAVSLAVDSQANIDLFSQGNAVPSQFYIPIGLFGYDPNYRNPYRQYDVEKAKRFLAEAGYPNGIDPKTGERLTLNFLTSATDAAGRQYVALVKKQIEAIGIRVDVRSYRSIVAKEMIDKGEFQLIGHLWIADYPDPEDFLYVLYGPNHRPGPNMCSYENPAYDRLFEQMRSMDDTPERLAIIRKMRNILVEDCPIIYIKHDLTLRLTQQWVRNMKPPNVDMDASKYLSIDGPRRARLQATWNRPNYLPAVALFGLLFAGSLPAFGVVRNRRRRRLRRNRGGG